MSEYIFDVPDENQPIAGESSVYYPDERDAPMIVREEIVRCRDCVHWATEARFTGMCVGKQFNPDGFCKWGERREQ